MGVPDWGQTEKYYWPHARGKAGRYSLAPFPGPEKLDSAALAWRWHHPQGRFHTLVVGGPLMDDQSNIYLAAEDGVRKFSKDGQELWHFKSRAALVSCPSLMEGRLFGSNQKGEAFALDMETGAELWSNKLAESTGVDTAYIEADQGVVILGVESGTFGGNKRVVGLNSDTGSALWEFQPSTPVWNFMPLFPRDGSAVFMDYSGGVYRLVASSGQLLWHTPPEPEDEASYSDGGVLLSPDGQAAYACSNVGNGTGQEGQHGVLRALALDDGRKLWRQELPHPCNSWPVVTADGTTVLVAIGSFEGMPPLMTSDASSPEKQKEMLRKHFEGIKLGRGEQAVWHNPSRTAGVSAFNAKTGAPLWQYEAPPATRPSAAGDEEGYLERLALGHRTICLPGPWSSPTLAADGAVYVGREDGDLYRLEPDPAGGSPQVSTFYAGAGFLHPGAAFAPGMMAIASCDSLFVFRT